MTQPDPMPPPTDPVPPVPYAGPTPTPPPGLAYAGPAPTPDAAMMGMLAHLLNVTLLGPLIIYLTKKDEHPFIADQSREALNFSLSCLIVHVICGVTAAFCIPALISIGLIVTQIVFGVVGGLKARGGVAYRYPLTFRFMT